jgi:hypothetical protein
MVRDTDNREASNDTAASMKRTYRVIFPNCIDSVNRSGHVTADVRRDSAQFESKTFMERKKA